MRESFLGEIIRQRRVELHMTQKQLGEGICEQVTISRFERGTQMPSRSKIKAILQRLGLPDERFYGLISRNEEHIKRLQNEIQADMERFDAADGQERAGIRARVLERAAKLEGMIESDDRVSRQFIMRARACLDDTSGYEVRLKRLMEAIRLTVPRFNLDNIDRHRYSGEELAAIKQIAECYSKMGRRSIAIDIYAQLLRYIENYYKSMRDYGGKFCMVSHCLSADLAGEARYEEAIAVADRGWRVCVEYGHYQYLASLIAVMAECWYKLGDREKSAGLYLQVYYIYKAASDDRHRELIGEEMKERLGLEPPG